MKAGLLRPVEAAKGQRSAPGTPTDSRSPLRDFESQEVKLVEAQLLRDFENHQRLSQPVSARDIKLLQGQLNASVHRNRLLERKVSELKNVLKELALWNESVLPVPKRAVTSFATQRPVATKTPVQGSVSSLLAQTAEVEEAIDGEDRETERLVYLYENTQRATIDSRQRFLALQKRWKLLSAKFDEVRDIKDKSKYDLQHAKSEALMFSESMKREMEKRHEKLEALRRDKSTVAEDAAKTVKLLAEAMVKERNTKTVAEAHALELDTIYTKHIGSQRLKSHDEQSLESLRRALMTVCEVVNRSETLNLEPKVTEVKLGDLIGFAHQFEMKMSSLESQVQSLSEWKHELERKCGEVHGQVDALRGNEFQVTETMARIAGLMRKLDFPQEMTTFNQYKASLESFPSVPEEESRHDAFLLSSYMTLHLVSKRILSLLDSISLLSGSHSNIGDLLASLASSQKHGEKLERAYTRSISPTNSEKSEGDPLDVELASASIFFREAFEDVTDWGLDLDTCVRQANDILLVRVFGVDQRLKSDLRNWKSAQLSILSESLQTLFLGKLVALTHGYMRGRLSELFSTLISLVKTVESNRSSLETDISKLPLSESQLSAILEFRQQQTSGAFKSDFHSSTDAIKKAFEQKFKKVLAQQRVRGEEDWEVTGKSGKRKQENITDPADGAFSTEEEFTATLRRLAKSPSVSDKSTFRSPTAAKTYALESSTASQELEAFAEVRTFNVRIRSIRNSEKPQTSTSGARQLPEIRTTAGTSTRGSARKSMKDIYTERQYERKRPSLKRV